MQVYVHVNIVYKRVVTMGCALLGLLVIIMFLHILSPQAPPWRVAGLLYFYIVLY
jgi:hypothetical protein